MSERLVVDSIMTAGGEVVPLGPVDKDGHRVPLDTTSLYGPRGEHYKVKSFVHFPLMREVRYYCRRCDSTVISLKKCEPEGVSHDR